MRAAPLLLIPALLAAPLAAQQRPTPAPPPAAPRPAPAERLLRTLEEARLADLARGARDLDLRLAGDLSRASLEAELAMRQGELVLRADELARQAEVMREHELAMAPLAAAEGLRASGGRLALLQPERGTQEDSLYRAAREALNRGEYQRAAQLFQSYQERYPSARTAPAALYWRAFALYRAGGNADLRAALAALEAQRSRYPATADDADAAALRVRVNAALAARGDQQAAAAVRAASAQGGSCDREEMEVRAEALNALVRQDEAGAMAILTRVLAQRDECSVTLRRRAVYHLGRRSEADAAARLLEVARNDPDRTVRHDAITLLGRMPGDQTIRNLEQIFTSTSDERTRAAVFSALRNHSSPESNRLLRRYIEDRSLPEALRASAVTALLGGSTAFALTSGDYTFVTSGQYVEALSAARAEAVTLDGRVVAVVPERPAPPAPPAQAPMPPSVVPLPSRSGGATEEDAAFLRALYPRETSRAVKDAIIGGLARMGGDANDRWLMGIVRDGNEEMRYRTTALARMRTTGVSVTDLASLYDAVSDRSLRTAIINTLGRREDDAATDKLFEIARTGTDPQLRRQAISALSRKNDPRTTRLLLELIER